MTGINRLYCWVLHNMRTTIYFSFAFTLVEAETKGYDFYFVKFDKSCDITSQHILIFDRYKFIKSVYNHLDNVCLNSPSCVLDLTHCTCFYEGVKRIKNFGKKYCKHG